MPKLIDDILLLIMDMADRRTHCVLMQTSSLFYGAGARHLLSGEVTLLTNEQTESFVMFMFADKARLKLLRTLRFGYYDGNPLHLSPRVAQFVTHLFAWLVAVGDLRALRIGSCEVFLRSGPRLLGTIAKLRTLKSLSVFDVGPLGRKMLWLLESRLVYVNIELSDEDVAGDSAIWLSKSRRSLRELRTTPADAYNIARAPVFEHLTRLTFFKLHIAIPFSGHYARMFPNLRELFVYDCDSDHREYWTDDIITQREDNMKNQLRLGRWPSLRLYEGGLPDLHSLGLTCQIDWVKLLDDYNLFEPFMFVVALQDARPIRLDLSLMGARWLLHDEVLSVFETPAAERLRSLTIDVLETEDDYSIDIRGAAENVITRIVTPLRSLVEFELILHCGLLAEDLPSLHSLDAEDLATRIRLANTSRSLQSISVALKCRCGRRSSRFGPQIKDFVAAYEEECHGDGEDATRAMVEELRRYGDSG